MSFNNNNINHGLGASDWRELEPGYRSAIFQCAHEERKTASEIISQAIEIHGGEGVCPLSAVRVYLLYYFR